MKIQKIDYLNKNFKSNKDNNKPEFIDKLMAQVKNPRDVSDCVVVPRGIFKAYLYLMASSSLMGIANCLPQSLKKSKMFLNISSAILAFLSAVFFAKPFALKGLSPTVKKQ